MALRRRPSPVQRALSRAVVASGQAIDLSDPKSLAEYRRRFRQTEIWQTQARYFTQEVPEVGFANDYTRDAMSRVGLLPALLADDPSERPVPLDDDTTPGGLDRDLCTQQLSRLEPFPELMGRVAQELDTTGECHVVLFEDDEDVDGERCRVLSVEELTTRDKFWIVRDDYSDTNGRPLISADGTGVGTRDRANPDGRVPPSDRDHPALIVADGGFFRIWQSDAAFWQRPDAPMRRLLGVCDELLLLTQLVQGIARSRIAMSGRILAIADEFSLTSAMPAPTEDAGDGEARADPFIEDLIVAATAAMTDPTSAAAALPIIIRGRYDLLEKGIISIDLDRKIDEMTLKLREEAINRIANGVNLPREVVLGIGATNHWNAEEIRNQAWKVHLEPRAMAITAAITEAFYRPQLLAEGVDREIVRRCVVAYDPSWFIGQPDIAESAGEAFANYAISWEAYRRATGWDPDDAPSENEVKLRLWIEQQKRVTERIQLDTPGGGVIEGEPSGPGDGPIDDANPNEQQAPAKPTAGPPASPEQVPGEPAKNTPPNAKAALMAASPRKQKLGRLGAKLVGIERDLRTRLQVEANAQAEWVLKRVGMKIQNGASRKRSDAAVTALAAQMKVWPLEEIAANIGPAGVQMLGLRDDELLADALGPLETRYRAQVKRSQEAALMAAAEASGRDVDLTDLDEELDGPRDKGWAIMAAGFGLVLARALYDPHPSAPPVGEFDATSLVPTSLIRGSLAAAGGAQVKEPETVDDISRLVDAFAPGDRSGEGATGGPTMTTIFSESLGIETATHTWVYGDAVRTREFEPHVELDGVDFVGWDDPALANDDSFPPEQSYFPGDHDGCLCSVETTFVDSAADEAAA